MEKKTGKTIITVSIIAIIIIALFAGGYLMERKKQQDLKQQANKISMLIDEVGQVKNQNELLLQYIVAEKKLYSGGTQQAEENKSESQKKALEFLLQKRDEIIQTLKNRSILPQDPAPTAPESKYLNMLIVGENMKLTDTILVANINRESQKITLLSIPRDLFYNGRKINEYYEKYGAEELEKGLKEILGIQIDKYVIVDMSTFIKVVDLFGGIDIDVPKDLTDYEYPTEKYGYTTVSFKKGLQHMDGTTALKYARSRKSTSDFDRSSRQQIIIAALKQKAEDINLKDNIPHLVEIYNAVKDGIQSDVSLVDLVNYYTNFRTYQLNSGNSISNQNYLYSTASSSGQYILLPKKTDFSEIQKYVQDLTM